jgi:hypothetical protein
VKTLRDIAFTYFILLVLTLFTLLFIPRAYSAPKPSTPMRAAPSHSTGSCRNLVEELNEMKIAQNQIINSLAQNHDTFADQLSDLSFELAIYKKNVPQKALDSMEKSAQAYRIRSHKAQETAQRLESLTSDLIQRVQRCLR